MKLFYPDGELARDSDPVRLSASNAGWMYCGLDVLGLRAGEERTYETDGVEAAFIPQSGSYVVEVSGQRIELAGRANVFSAVTDLAYIPLDAEVRITAIAPGELAITTSVAERQFDPAYIPAGDVAIEIRGAGQATRQINNFMSADRFDGADKLIAVEVLTPAGNWSSYPPHKHDEHTDVERPLEEIYYFRIEGETGFGLHRTYTLDGDIDETVTVRDGDVFLIPRGYHGPCVAPPGYHMYYLNVMAGPERTWMMCTDPAHEWLWDAWSDVAQDPRLPLT